MDHKHEQSHASSRGATSAATDHGDTVEPGQSIRSALLRKSDDAVASGLVNVFMSPKPAASSLEQRVPSDNKNAVSRAHDTRQDQNKDAQSASSGPAVPMSNDMQLLAGAYFPGTEKNAKAFIQTKAEGSRGYLEEHLGKLKAEWKAAGRVKGGQDRLKALWQPWYKNYRMAKLKKLDYAACVALILKLQKSKNNTKAVGGEKWNDVTKSGKWCGTGVTWLFKEMTGLTKSGNGKDWDRNMRNAIAAGEVPYREEENPAYANLPNGSVLVWQSGASAAGSRYGHACVVVDGYWVSDHITPAGRQGTGTPQSVFVPTVAAE